MRKNNQDSAYISPTMIVVADGMGGAAAGDVASTVAIHELRRADGHYTGEHMLEAMAGAMTKANDSIADLITADPRLDGMGTTVSGAMFSGSQLGLVHIGDSRGYLLRAGELTRLTHDHSWVQSLVDAGKITEAEAAVHPHRSLLLKVLNGQPVHEPDYSLVDLEQGDRLLFCSDGLCGLVDDKLISRLLGDPDAEQAKQALVDAAYASGGYDNITVIIADVVDQDPALDARSPLTLGAAATVEIPRVSSEPATMGGAESGAGAIGARSSVGAAANGPVPAPAALDVTAAPPDGLIDPDAHEEIRYSPTINRRPHRWPVVVGILLALALIAGGVFGARMYMQGRYYLAPDQDQVSIWQGLPDTIAGKPLSHLVEQRTTKVGDLPVYYADQVRASSITADSLEQARSQADYLDRLARGCIQARAERSASPQPSASQPAPSTTLTPSGAMSTSTALTSAPSSIPISGTVNPQDCA
ncbi:MAG: protein phosphatase 2C domain-containing protein [Propionibacterium sp.]